MKFKAGDIVRVKVFSKTPKGWNDDGRMDHLMGEVVKIDTVYNRIAMIYDVVEDRVWAFSFDELEPVTTDSIVIFRKGNQVIALDKVTGEKGIARCCPDDTFDFKTGAKLAFERLMKCDQSDEPEYYSGKIVFTKGDNVFKTGHIYEIKDGVFEKSKVIYPLCQRFKDIDGVKDYFTAFHKRKKNPGWSTETLELIEVLGEGDEEC